MHDPNKSEAFYYFMDTSKVHMAGEIEEDGHKIKGIEDFVPGKQYGTDEHKQCVLADICNNWPVLSHGGKFHAIFATSSIPEAIEYYRLLKAQAPNLKVCGLFDPSIDNNPGAIFKEDGLVELMEDYNTRYNKAYTIPTHAQMKKDISTRLAHKSLISA